VAGCNQFDLVVLTVQSDGLTVNYDPILPHQDDIVGSDEASLLPRRRFLTASGIIAAACAIDSDLIHHGLDASVGGYRYHLVKRGDTLSELGETYHTTVSRLKQLNGLKSDILRIGQKLKIGTRSKSSLPSSTGNRFHTVKRGDTLSGIGVRYSVSVSRLKALNGMHSDLVRIGQRLTVSGTAAKRGLQHVKPALVKVRNLRRSMWKNIIGHHSAIKQGNAKIYGRSHKERGMKNGLAYHFVIGNGIDSGDGEIEIGPRWLKQIEGGHVKSRKYNLNSIGVCVIGDFNKSRPSSKQIAAFEELVAYLKYDLLGGKPKFMVHRELEQTACPGKLFPVSAMHKRFG
jgi:LysM repeat protein